MSDAVGTHEITMITNEASFRRNYSGVHLRMVETQKETLTQTFLSSWVSGGKALLYFI